MSNYLRARSRQMVKETLSNLEMKGVRKETVAHRSSDGNAI